MKNKLSLGHSFNSKELFQNFPVRKMELSAEQCRKDYPDKGKREYAASIFVQGMQMIIDDIIENNVMFKLPGMGKTQSYIYVKRFTGDDFKALFRGGKWRDVDFIASNFSAHQLCFKMESSKRTEREKLIYTDNTRKNRLTELTNQGKQY